MKDTINPFQILQWHHHCWLYQ